MIEKSFLSSSLSFLCIICSFTPPLLNKPCLSFLLLLSRYHILVVIQTCYFFLVLFIFYLITCIAYLSITCQIWVSPVVFISTLFSCVSITRHFKFHSHGKFVPHLIAYQLWHMCHSNWTQFCNNYRLFKTLVMYILFYSLNI